MIDRYTECHIYKSLLLKFLCNKTLFSFFSLYIQTIKVLHFFSHQKRSYNGIWKYKSAAYWWSLCKKLDEGSWALLVLVLIF